ncbi:hypothetical protein AAG747_09765 [Rapidithrix thailandica]|uniref:Uncharacterized protein n=1 Tax=Rapidithrix thailandica TaxID=413964 RepID=A0AAW9SBU4_9BACT
MKITLSILLLFSISFAGKAQTFAPNGRMDMNTNPGAVITTKKPTSHTVLSSSYYLKEQWMHGLIKLKKENSAIRGKFRYNLITHYIEVIQEEELNYISRHDIAGLEWQKTDGNSIHFVNAMGYRKIQPVRGMLEVLIDGKTMLFRHSYLALKEPDYIAALQVGSQHSQITLASALYFGKQGQLVKVPFRKKKILEYFAPYQNQLKKFIKQHHLKIRKAEDLSKLVHYYNSL